MNPESLDLGLAASAPIVDAASRYPHSSLAIVLFVFYVLFGLFILWRLVSKAVGKWIPPVSLSQWPPSGKALATLLLIAFGLVHVFALMEIYLQSRVSFTSTEEYFFYMSPTKLAATSHAHFFGHAVMYGLTSFMFLFTGVGERWKVLVIALTLAGGLLDVPSWWMIKYAGGRFEVFSILAAALSSTGWLMMASRIAFEIHFSKKTS